MEEEFVGPEKCLENKREGFFTIIQFLQEIAAQIPEGIPAIFLKKFHYELFKGSQKEELNLYPKGFLKEFQDKLLAPQYLLFFDKHLFFAWHFFPTTIDGQPWTVH